MSLFSLRSLWSYTPLSTEQFDRRHIAIGSIDSTSTQKIILASYSGHLRIFKPGTPFKQTDLLFSQTYPEPIVSIKISQLSKNYLQNQKSVLVLFARKLLILNFESTSDDDISLTLQKSQELSFSSPCFNCFAKPLLAVSLNSELHYLYPPSTINIKVSQPIYSCAIEEDNFYYVDGEDLVMSKVGIEQWRVLVGEVNDVHVWRGEGKEDGVKLVCVGEKEYWIVSENGVIEGVKRIEGEISASMIIKKSTGFNIVLSTFSKLLLVYDQGKLIWGAKTPFTPISINTISISSKPGILCLLSDTGVIDICYLGTDQLTQIIQPLAPSIDLAEIQSQIYRLQQELKKKQTKNPTAVEQKASLLTATCTHCRAEWTDDYVEEDEKLFQIDGKKRVLNVKVQLNPTQTLYHVRVQLKIPTNMYSEKILVSIDQLQISEEIQFAIYLELNHFPYVDTISFSISYFQTPHKVTLRSFELSVPIPFSFQCLRSTTAQKDKSNHKIILNSNKDLPKILQIFSDVEIYSQTPNEMQIFFLLSSNIYTSILASKHASKYKISSSFYQGLWIIILQFIKRAKKYSAQLTVESVPLQQLFVISESHFKLQHTLSSLKLSIQQSSKQLKTIQKKILLKIKDKNCDLSVLEELLDAVVSSSVGVCNQYEGVEDELQAVTHQLMISVLIVCELLFLRGKVSKEGRKVILGVLRVEEKRRYREGWTWEHQVVVNCSKLQGKKVTKTELEGLEFEKVRKVLLWIVDKTAKGEIK